MNTDWQYEEAAERTRQQSLQSQRGIRHLISSFFEGTRVWLVLGLTGVGVGLIGACLDILVAWLSDLRAGRCKYGFFYNEVACCSGLDGSCYSIQ
jgi:chloride channel 3/4/5